MITGALIRLAATIALSGAAAAGLSPPTAGPALSAAPAPPPVPRGSGNDECSGAVPLAGAFVTFAFDNNSATTGSYAQDNPGCEFFGYRGIERDEWFLWTAPDTGGASLSSCEGSLYDTKAAVYDTAACPPTNLLAGSTSSKWVSSPAASRATELSRSSGPAVSPRAPTPQASPTIAANPPRPLATARFP
jgi:hypothetical protein